MNHLIARATALRATIESGPFFTSLAAGELDAMRWVHQLRHQSRRFTQALSLRAALCRDDRFLNVFAAHAVEEGRHPEQLEQWMRRHEIRRDPVPPTAATQQLTDYCALVAQYGDPTVQVLTLNVLSEGVALDFYRAVIDWFGRDRLDGPYWHIHKEVDELHLAMGVDLCRVDEVRRHEYESALDVAAELYAAMLTSWVAL